MKKLYAFLSAFLVAAVAMAAPANLPKFNVQLTPEGKKALTERAAQLMTPDGKFIVPEENVLGTRSYTVGNMIYTLRFVHDEQIEWYKVLTFTNPETGQPIPPEEVTFEYYPFYNVLVLMVGYDTSKDGDLSTYLPFYTFWPCHYYFDQRYEFAGEEIPDDEVDYSLVSISDLCEGAKSGYCNRFREGVMTSDGGFNPNPIMNGNDVEAWNILPGAIGASLGSDYYYNGVDGASTYQDGSLVMEYVFKDYLAETNEINASFKYPLVYPTGTGGSRKVTLNIAYNGTCRVDFEPTTYDIKATELHIFNTGEASTDILGVANDPYPDHEWGPLTRYRVYASLSEYIAVRYPDEMKTFNQNQIGFQFKEGVASSIQVSPDAQCYYYGSLYSAADSKSPENQTWNFLTPSYSYDDFFQIYILDMYPVAGSAITYYTMNVYDDDDNPVVINETYPQYDGSIVFWKGDNESPMGGGVVKTNTKNGFELVGKDLTNNTIFIHFDGKIKYHDDPKNATAYKEIDSVGDEAKVEEIAVEGAQINVVDGQVIINATADAEVAVYNVNGMLVKALSLVKGENAAIELANGIYIVKVGNEVKKVVL